MINYKRFLATVSVSVTLLASIPMASAAAATSAPLTELKSTTFSGQCMDVYHDKAVAGTTVRLFPCSTSNSAELFSLNKQHIYFTPDLCVGSSLNSLAELQDCTNTKTNETEITISKLVVAFNFSAGVLTAHEPVTSSPYPRLNFQSANGSSYTGQAWKIVTVH